MQNKLAKYYCENASRLGWGESNGKLDKERLDLIDRYLVGQKILDVGCGMGLYVDYLSSKGYESFGLDLVGKFVENARSSKRGRFFKGKAEKLPFKNNYFDTVLLFDILEHGDDIKILEETKRVTKKRILIIVPREVDKLLADTGVVFRHYIDKTHIREYRSQDLEILAKKVKLKQISLQEIHSLNNKIIFQSLLKGPDLMKGLLRKVTFSLLSSNIFPTEYFMVLDKI